jgi:hypothetical protein
VPGGGDVRQSASLDLGQRIFDDASAHCIDEQLAVGLEYTIHREDGMFGYEFGVNHHYGHKDIAATGHTMVRGWEINAGLRREFPSEGSDLVPYAALGIDAFYVDRNNELPGFFERRDLGMGAYARVGAVYHLSQSAFVGLDVRFIQEDWVDNGGYDLDGDVVSLVLGIRF